MYQFSRAIYRELAADILVDGPACMTVDGSTNHERVLKACEATIERLFNDRRYFARPSRTLFNDIRIYFPMSQQQRVYRVIERYLSCAEEFLARMPRQGFDVNGQPLQCRATTRKGTACQRTPLPHNGYCPSHQHLAESEDYELVAA